MKLTRAEVFDMALKHGVIDPDLSDDGQMVTDYGDSTEEILAFVREIEERLSQLTLR
jgi:hypothetical protein